MLKCTTCSAYEVLDYGQPRPATHHVELDTNLGFTARHTCQAHIGETTTELLASVPPNAIVNELRVRNLEAIALPPSCRQPITT